MTFRVLMVCTGNVCRSPLAEQLLRARLSAREALRDEVMVSSAGTHALVGEPETAQNQTIAIGLGVPQADAAAHRARLLTEQIVRDADLVIALSRGHRRAVVELVPAVSRRTFTLRELARIGAELDADTLAASRPKDADAAQALTSAIELAGAYRGTLLPLDDPTEDDVVDPYRQSDGVYSRSAAQLAPAVDEVVGLLDRALVSFDGDPHDHQSYA